MNNKVATIIDIKMTDTTRHAQATQISSAAMLLERYPVSKKGLTAFTIESWKALDTIKMF